MKTLRKWLTLVMALTAITAFADASVVIDTADATFTGQCDFNLEVSNPKAEIVVPAIGAAICVPRNWSINTVVRTGAQSNSPSPDWDVQRLGIKNVMYIHAQSPKARPTVLWIYPVNEAGESPLRFELTVKANS